MKPLLPVFILLLVVVGLPFLLRPKDNLLAEADDTLVIITPNNEAIRWEFSHAFSEYYKRKTGRTVQIDWRLPGGTSDIARYVKSAYYSAFQLAWTSAGKPWNTQIATAFDSPRPSDQPAAQEARAFFLNSDIGIGIDLFFGGGAYDFIQQAEAGRLVDCGVLQRHPEWFGPDRIPDMVSGEPFYDPKGRWVGTVLSAFGICYNVDSIRRLGVVEIPAAWSDLTNPRFLNQVALADPTKSGSAAKAFEMIIQQQMQQVGSDRLAEGWKRGLNLIQGASANARYFTDAASRVPVDVSAGDAAIGMCIDFYGRFQSEAIQLPGQPAGEARMQYFTPLGGSSLGVDPIGMFRGAPNPQIAQAFIDFVLSLEGQKLWNFRVGTPGGPVKYALRRLPVVRELYEPKYRKYFSDASADPYEEARHFVYHPEWTGGLFRTIGFVIRAACLDPHDEQKAAWKALIAANFPPKATARFYDISAIDYVVAQTKIRPALNNGDLIAQVRLARELSDKFRRQYQEAEALARTGQ